MSGRKLLVVIAGPTASGKTALAIRVAKALQTEIISADSRQFYREMNIGTAKPTRKELEEVKHHFIDTWSVSEEVSAGKFEEDCIPLLDELFKKHEAVVMCGGSGLYIDAVCKGFDPLPGPEPGTRDKLNRIYKGKGIEQLREMLKKADPDYYEQVDKNNPRRIIRALEICSTGKKYSELRKGKSRERNFDVIYFGIETERKTLYENIDARVEEMISNGLVEEARRLYPKKELKPLQTFGYMELFRHFDGELSLEEAISLIKQNTRNYAKRQMTWFRKKDMRWVRSPEEILDAVGEWKSTSREKR